MDIGLATIAKWFPSDVVVYKIGTDTKFKVMYVFFRDRHHLDSLVEAVGEKTVLSMLSEYLNTDEPTS